jgi:hypothetical protein
MYEIKYLRMEMPSGINTFPTSHPERPAVGPPKGVKSFPSSVLLGDTVPCRSSFVFVNEMSRRGCKVVWPLDLLDSLLQPRGKTAAVVCTCCYSLARDFKITVRNWISSLVSISAWTSYHPLSILTAERWLFACVIEWERRIVNSTV